MSDICNDDEEIKQEIKKEIKPSTVVKTKKKKREGTLRKAPQAPKRFKSSYIIFFMAKQEEIKKGLNSSGSSVSPFCFFFVSGSYSNKPILFDV